MQIRAYEGLKFRRYLCRSPFVSNSSTIMAYHSSLIRNMIILCLINLSIAYWFSYGDHTHQLDDIGVSELSINGRLLEELDLLFL